MLIITRSMIERIYQEHGEEGMVCCYAKAQSMSAATNQAVLMMDDQKVIICFMGFFSNNVVHKVVFDKRELSDSTLSTGLGLDEKWHFFARGQKWRFRIMIKIMPLGSMQNEFLNYLGASDFLTD